MAQPLNKTSLEKSPIYRLRGLKDRLVYPHPELSPENCIVISNINFSEKNLAASRHGYEKYNTTVIPSSEPMMGFIEESFASYGAKRLFCTPDKIYTDDGSTRSDITSSVSLSGSNDEYFTLDFVQDTIVGTNGKDNCFKWAGTGNAAAFTFASDSTAFTTAEQLIEHNNALVVLAPTISSSKKLTRIIWSDVNTKDFTGDITRYPSNSRYEIGGENSAPIIGGVDNWGKLWIAKTDGIYPGRLEYNSGYIEYVPDEEVGNLRGFHPVSKTSMVARPEFIFGIAREGGYVITPEGKFSIVTKDIDFQDTFNMNRLQYAVSSIREKEHQVRVLMSSSANTTGHDLILSWDWENGDISIDKHETTKLSYISHYFDSGIEYDLLGGYSSGYMYKSNTGTDDDGTAIQWEIETAPNDLGFPGVEKTIHNVVLFYRDVGDGPQSITLQLIRDEGIRGSRTKFMQLGTDLQYDEGHQYDTALRYPGGGNDRKMWGCNRTALTAGFRITGSSTVSLVGYQIWYTVDDTTANTAA
jgi:hypothetical protein